MIWFCVKKTRRFFTKVTSNEQHIYFTLPFQTAKTNILQFPTQTFPDIFDDPSDFLMLTHSELSEVTSLNVEKQADDWQETASDQPMRRRQRGGINLRLSHTQTR